MYNQSNADDQEYQAEAFQSLQGRLERVPYVVINDTSMEIVPGPDESAFSETFQPSHYLTGYLSENDGATTFSAREGSPQFQMSPESEYLSSPYLSPYLPTDNIPPVPYYCESTTTTSASPSPALSTNLLEDMPLPSIGGPSQSEEIPHSFRRIVDKETIDSCIQVCNGNTKVFQCKWEACQQTFNRREKARMHVRKHLKIDKEFECITCGEKFASRRTAKRHSKSQIKQYKCRYCPSPKSYARKDYCRSHEKRCLKKNFGSPIGYPVGGGPALFSGNSEIIVNSSLGLTFSEGPGPSSGSIETVHAGFNTFDGYWPGV